MTLSLQNDINGVLSNPYDGLADHVAGAADAAAAIEAADLQLNDIERSVLEGLPTTIWHGLRGLMVHGIQSSTPMQIEFGFGGAHELRVAVATDGSHTVSLLAPEPPASAS